MSLNYVEIDHILKELDLNGTYLQSIYQPTHSKMVLHFFKKKPQSLLLSLEGENTRLHGTWRKHPNTLKLQRFAQLLRSRLTGAKLVKMEQIEGNRLVLMEFSKDEKIIRLWARLWGNQANLILTDENNKIIDCFFRKPTKGETSGKIWAPPTALPPAKEYSLRFENPEDYNQQIEAFYADKIQEVKETKGKDFYRDSLKKKLSGLQKIREGLEVESNPEKSLGLKLWGDLILSHYPSLEGKETVLVEGATIPTEGIESPSELAELYFKRYKKLKETARHAEERSAELDPEIAFIQQALDELEEEDWNAEKFEGRYRTLVRTSSPSRAKPSASKEAPVGLTFISGDFTILVGRNAKENDTLLRKQAKSQDMWLHLRDFPGSYAFVKHKKDKTFPLEVLLDAGMLALFFSQKRKLKRADLYYTLVKHLRRAKGAKLGTVIPTNEKNLSVTLEEERLTRLLGNKNDLSF